MSKLSHTDESGRARMVDVSTKEVTRRTARASGRVRMNGEARAAIEAARAKKGDPLETARLAGITAAKRTAELIPLCHPLGLEHIDVQAAIVDDGVELSASATVTAKTGAEMEALTAVSVAALTVYDMCKSVDRGMVIGEIRLESKSGGRSESYERGAP